MKKAKKIRSRPGPKPRGPFKNKRRTLTTRITDRTRQGLERAAAITDRSLSQEIEFRLERSLSDQDARATERAAEFGGEAIYDFMKKLARVAGIVGLKTGADFGKDAYTRAEAISAMKEVLDAFQIKAAGAATGQGRGFAAGEPSVGSLGKKIAEGPGAEIGRDIFRFVLGLDREPNQPRRTRKKRE